MALQAKTRDQLMTGAGAFATGIGMGYALKARPDLGTMGTVILAGGAIIGTMVTTGTMTEVLEGVAAASLGALGAQVPYWIASTPAAPAAPTAAQRAALAARTPRLLTAAIDAGGVERGVLSNARVRVV